MLRDVGATGRAWIEATDNFHLREISPGSLPLIIRRCHTSHARNCVTVLLVSLQVEVLLEGSLPRQQSNVLV